MKVLLVLGVVFAVSVELSSAACYNQRLSMNLKMRKGFCDHKGKVYPIGSKWTTECEKCSCDKSGMECCTETQTPDVYDKENCEAIYNAETCSYTVTRKDNPSVICEVFAMKG